MARIISVEDGHQDVRGHVSEVECYVQQVTTADGELLVHISTFGSVQRQSAPKSSQSMQFDLAAAAALVDRFVTAFGPAVLPDR
ncbi:hypothetical protein [Microbacterium jejuense]|uniref:hypothetical protein n=1 Tax=Microbacterium jejuense TaxID=1263637 RepID=UPI0031EF5BCE